MIELNEKTQQDFLNREWVQKLLDAGVDMSDAKYFLHKYSEEGPDYVLCYYEEDVIKEIEESNNKCRERIYNRIKKKNYKTLPTYTVSELLYKLRNRYDMYTIFNCYRNLDTNNVLIIESLASILLQGCKKDTNNG